MGNCQWAKAALAAPAAEIEHPDGRIERIYCPISASHVMSAQPGNYVAVVTSSGGEETTVKHLTLLQPDDNLHLGNAYRLVSFEDMLRVFGSKKRVRLSRLIQLQKKRDDDAGEAGNSSPEMLVGPSFGYNGGRTNCSVWRQRQWKPTLQTIAEVGAY